MAGVLLKRNVRLDRFLDELIAAALASYSEVSGARSSTHEQQEIEQDLRKRFRELLRVDMVVGEECGLSILCHEATLLEPWSEEAKRALREEEEAAE